MRRRDFIALTGGAATAWPFALHAQQPNRTRRIGVFTFIDDADAEGQIAFVAFRREMERLGWVTGRNLAIEYIRSNIKQVTQDALELVRSKPDLILATGTPTTQAVPRAAEAIPIVFVDAADPAASGLVTSLTHPEGNKTGFANYEFSIATKWLGLLKEVVPSLSRVLALYISGNDAQL